MERIEFTEKSGQFRLKNPCHTSGLYLPVASLTGLKSSVTPDFGGDSKTDQNHFLIAPKSVSNLHTDRDTRNFFLVFGDGLWSATGVSASQEAERFTDSEEESVLEAGRMWQKVTRSDHLHGVKASVRLFALLDTSAEVMTISLENSSEESAEFTPVAAIPVYGRSADNLRDHRHVTSLLNRAVITDGGVVLKPTLSFDERGHQINESAYYVFGADERGNLPERFMADEDEYIGEGGTYLRPGSLVNGLFCDDKWLREGDRVNGRECTAVLRFTKRVLAPGEKCSYNIIIGIEDGKGRDPYDFIKNAGLVEETFEEVKKYWEEAVPVHFHTADESFDSFMEWVSFQPQLRRIYGCSFLPHHDYGRGGRGWRDLWQDCLALLLTDPDGVRQMLLDNFRGVRTDGTNATIIGDNRGVFKSDRNGIPRVWMDHGFWPFLTVRLYIDQTGDVEILGENVTYFKDALTERAQGRDEDYTADDGVLLRSQNGEVYEGSVIEHLLIENLTAVLDVGDHNICLLRCADWNDALDMAPDKGESVAFTCAYAGNLKSIAEYLRVYAERTGIKNIYLLKELEVLLEEDSVLMSDAAKKRDLLERYMKSVGKSVSGEKTCFDAQKLSDILDKKAEAIMEHIRQNEWVKDSEGNGWFNGYYDNFGRKVEGEFTESSESVIRMMLTGQVFSIMSKTATGSEIEDIVKSADKYLFDDNMGGYRLNTDFGAVRMDLGRMFGFSYGDKENGAVFSHMETMFGNALYQRGFAREGYRALDALYRACSDFEKARIYPGIPEYFNLKGRGLYHYLTDAGSWYLLTLLTEVFGVRGNAGDFRIEPKLVKEQFDIGGKASVSLSFRGKKVIVSFLNTSGKDYGEYEVAKAAADGKEVEIKEKTFLEIPADVFDEMPGESHSIEVELV